MAGYEHESVRHISDDITLECNFDLNCFPAIIRSKTDAEVRPSGMITLNEKELTTLMVEIANRLGCQVLWLR